MFRRRMGRGFKQGYVHDQFPNETLESHMGASGAPPTPSPPSLEHHHHHLLNTIPLTPSQPSFKLHHSHPSNTPMAISQICTSSAFPFLTSVNIHLPYFQLHTGWDEAGAGALATHIHGPWGLVVAFPFLWACHVSLGSSAHSLTWTFQSKQRANSQHSTGLLNNYHWH